MKRPNVRPIRPDADKPTIEDLKKIESKLLETFSNAAETRAKILKIGFDKYVKAGFTEGQAMQLVKKSMELEVATAIHKAVEAQTKESPTQRSTK